MIEKELLPKYMHKKNGAYYFVAAVGTKRKWIRLSRNLVEACARMAEIQSGNAEILPPRDDGKDWLNDSFRIILSNSRGRAKKLGIEHTLTKLDLQTIASQSRYCCAVTGMLFSNEKVGHSGTRPFFPSLDRKDSKKGYTPDNCRLVTVVANYAMNAWGVEILTKIAIAHLRNIGFSVRRV